MIVTFLIPDHQIIYVSYNHLLNLEKWNKSKFGIQYVLVIITVNNSFGYDQNILAKYFSIRYLLTGLFLSLFYS